MDTQNIVTICFVISTILGLIGVYVKLIQAIDNQEKLIEGINQRLSNVELNQRTNIPTLQTLEKKTDVLANIVETHQKSVAEQQVGIKQLDKYTTQIFERLKSISDNQMEIKETVKEIEKSVKASAITTRKAKP